MTIKIDREKCSGCGTCVDICPVNVFKLQENLRKNALKVVAEHQCFACRACELKCAEQAIKITGYEMLKVDTPTDYPPEEGRYLRGNDYSPVALVAILDTYDFKIPTELVRLIEVAIESGVALAGTLQTENIGIEKVIVNVVANPNIRYLILCWRESHGHLAADALENLVNNGVAKDKRRTIIGAQAPAPYLPNISLEAIERFRKQITIVNLISENQPKRGMDPENIRKGVWSCIQEKPTEFLSFNLFDPGAWPEPPICQRISMKILEPWRPELSEREREITQRIKNSASKTTTQRENRQEEGPNTKSKENETLLLEFLGINIREKNKKKRS